MPITRNRIVYIVKQLEKKFHRRVKNQLAKAAARAKAAAKKR